MQVFRTADGKKYVNIYAIELYLPSDYTEKAYRGYEYYSVAGTKVRYYGLGNMRLYENQKQMESPMTVPVHTLGVPMILTAEPSEIDVREVQFTKGGPIRRCIVLTFYKDDIFLDSLESIKTNNNVMIYLTRLQGGKLDHVSPQEAVSILQDVQRMNGVKLRIPSEEEEIFIAERYRSDRHPSMKARLDDDANPDKLISYNMREEAMKVSTYQAVTHEDINTSLISSINRTKDGKEDEAGAMERIVRGLPMDDYIAERDARLAAEQEKQMKKETGG